MGILDRYSVIHCSRVSLTKTKVFVKPKPEAVHVLGDVKPITIAEIHPSSMGKITAHRLKDYRHKNFSLMLLPDVYIMLDELLREVGDINEYPEFANTYSKG